MAAHELGAVSVRTLSFMTNMLRTKIEDIKTNLMSPCEYGGEHQLPDPLTVNLVSNVLRGELKSIARRTREVRLMERRSTGRPSMSLTVFAIKKWAEKSGVEIDDEVARNVLEGLLPRKTTINDVFDPITPETLVDRSTRRLSRLGKPNTFY